MKPTGRIFVLVLLVMLALPVSAEAVTRAEILARANRWVDLEVPYDQGSYYESYRQDCSGMTSMAWKLGHSYSSRTLSPLGTMILRDELQPGDMMLKYDYHAGIFYKWADSDHEYYWMLEQSGSVGHAVMRLTRFPYWGHEGFAAYRHNQIEEIDDYGPYILEVAGPQRYETAFAASRLAFESGEASRAVICSGATWPDALGGSALAGTVGGPILLVGRDFVPAGLAEELARLGVEQVTLIGGEGAVSPEVEAQIESLPGITVERIGGADRYETAALVASRTVDTRIAEGKPWDGAFYLSTGLDFADALGAATVAAHTGRPILLTRPDALPSVTASAVASMEATRAYVAGGQGAIEETTTAGLVDIGVEEITRFAGRTRYETSLLLARHAADEGLVWDDVAIATGTGFADALAGAVMQARRGSPLVLTPSGYLSTGADWAIREHMDVVEQVTVLGGEAAVRPLARRQIRWMMDEPPGGEVWWK